MGKYFYLQWKRIARLLPAALCVAAILFGALAATFTALTQFQNESERTMRIRIGIVGDTDHSFFQIGLQALAAFDSTRFAIELKPMAEEEAEAGLKSGELSSYAVIPPEFMENALRGRFMQIDFVSTAGATGITSLLKEDFTGVISDILSPAQRGTYGILYALRDQGLDQLASPMSDKMALRYVEQALTRASAYEVELVGMGNGLSFENYLLCGLSVMLLSLLCLTFAPVMICHDHSLSRLLRAKGSSVAAQTAVEFAAYFTVQFLLLSVIYAVLAAVSAVTGFSLPSGWSLSAFLPVLIMVAALSYLLYTLSGDLISGVLLQFFVILAMGFVSGCLYPVYFFPEKIQQLAAWLPTGIARVHLAAYVTGDSALTSGLLLLLCTAVFLSLAVWARSGKLRRLGR